jgi:hypothetical protein
LVFSSPTSGFKQIFVAGKAVDGIHRHAPAVTHLKLRYAQAMQALWA